MIERYGPWSQRMKALVRTTLRRVVSVLSHGAHGPIALSLLPECVGGSDCYARAFFCCSPSGMAARFCILSVA